MIDLSIITVTHQSQEHIEDLITSVICGAHRIRTEHLIVDNASTDETCALIEQHFSSYVTLWKNEENRGFSAANNRALSYARGRYILFLNPDMKVEAGSLDRFVAWMDGHSDVGIGTCKLVDPLGRFLRHRCPFSFPKFGKNVLWLLSPFFRIARAHCELEFQEEAEVEAVLGAFLVARRSFLDELGFAFDPRYFLTFEDIDLCREAKRLGYKVMYYSGVSCIDYNSQSFSQKPFLWIYRQVARGMYLYFRKWEKWYVWMCVALLIPVGFSIRYLLNKKIFSGRDEKR